MTWTVPNAGLDVVWPSALQAESLAGISAWALRPDLLRSASKAIFVEWSRDDGVKRSSESFLAAHDRAPRRDLRPISDGRSFASSAYIQRAWP
jgi:hypothetical protein